MSVKELEREKLGAAKLVSKQAEPSKYSAVYRQDASYVCNCNINLLTDVFNISAVDAHRHIKIAIKHGQSSVITGPKDVIETKVNKANAAIQSGCWRLGEYVRMTAEPC